MLSVAVYVGNYLWLYMLAFTHTYCTLWGHATTIYGQLQDHMTEINFYTSKHHHPE